MQSAEQVAAYRAFNRFWTAHAHVLGPRLLGTLFSLTEARVLFELAQRPATPTSDLLRTLGLDAGYLSRILKRLTGARLISTAPAEHDARKQIVSLTAAGKRGFRELDERSAAEVTAVLARLPEDARLRMLAAMREIERALTPQATRMIVLRAPRAGDLGWVVERHGAVYASEYGWNDEFEGLVAKIIGEYVAKRDPELESAWIAEVDGERAGCVFCVRKSARTAQLRLLLVEPSARGLGLGTRLVEECIAFARARGYKDIVLWTNDVLHSARRIYEAAGFQLSRSGRHHSFGHDLVEQTWRKQLS